jgi:acetolactate synthase-1/2/3 large subunit
MPFYDALVDSSLKHILVRHEQGAALAANGFARASGKVGVCVATSGPGASNLVTGIADAMLDSVPMVCITGQVGTPLLGTDAFQELDVFGMTLPIVKHSWLVRSVDDLPRVVAEASASRAKAARPGADRPAQGRAAGRCQHLPAHVPAASSRRRRRPRPPWPRPGRDGRGRKAGGLRRRRHRPGRCRAGPPRVRRSHPHPHRADPARTGRAAGRPPAVLGMLGMHGTRAANMAVQECDLLIVVGARFDDRATGKLAEFAPFARVIHRRRRLRDPSCAVPTLLFRAMSATPPRTECGLPPRPRGRWRERVRNRARFGARYDARQRHLRPGLLKRLSELAPADAILACDVGQHQMWVAQHCRFDTRATT